jgi:hypothetical protein
MSHTGTVLIDPMENSKFGAKPHRRSIFPALFSSLLWQRYYCMRRNDMPMPSIPLTDHGQQHSHQMTVVGVIEVCQGPDCTGLGGGAALLEIEELVAAQTTADDARRAQHQSQLNPQQQQHQPLSSSYRVVSGACRNLCSVGPNVHLLRQVSTPSNTSTDTLLEESFAAIKSVSACQHVARAIASRGTTGESADTTTPATDIASSLQPSTLMIRRMQGIRWECLRQVARILAKAAAQRKTGDNGGGAIVTETTDTRKERYRALCHEQLVQMRAAEMAAVINCNNNNKLRARAEQRLQRLEQLASRSIDQA